MPCVMLTEEVIVVVNIDYQINKIYNHQENKPLGTPMRDILDWVK